MAQTALALAAVFAADRVPRPRPEPTIEVSLEECDWLLAKLDGAATACLVTTHGCIGSTSPRYSAMNFRVKEQWRGDTVLTFWCVTTRRDRKRVRFATTWGEGTGDYLYLAYPDRPPVLIPFKDEYRRILGPAPPIRPAAAP